MQENITRPKFLRRRRSSSSSIIIKGVSSEVATCTLNNFSFAQKKYDTNYRYNLLFIESYSKEAGTQLFFAEYLLRRLNKRSCRNIKDKKKVRVQERSKT
jgi:hypothetical protein